MSGVAIFPKSVSQKTSLKKWYDTAFRGRNQPSSENTNVVGTQGPDNYQLILMKYQLITKIFRFETTIKWSTATRQGAEWVNMEMRFPT